MGRISTRYGAWLWGFVYKATRALVRSDTSAGRDDLGCGRHSISSQRCSAGLRSGLCADHSSSWRCDIISIELGPFISMKANLNATFGHIV